MTFNGGLNLAKIAFFGRTFSEYSAMFDLSHELLATGPVLDCPAGASSFAAEANTRGYSVVAADLLYGLEPQPLIRKGREDLELVMAGVEPVKHLFRWEVHKDVEGLRRARSEALERFAEDYPQGQQQRRYVPADLPKLPFGAAEFRLVLSGHFLFLYADRLDFEFHAAVLKELCRVATHEVRIFPLLGLDAQPYPRLDELRQRLQAEGIKTEVCKVPYEFQKGGNEMLRLTIACLHKERTEI